MSGSTPASSERPTQWDKHLCSRLAKWIICRWPKSSSTPPRTSAFVGRTLFCSTMPCCRHSRSYPVAYICSTHQHIPQGRVPCLFGLSEESGPSQCHRTDPTLRRILLWSRGSRRAPPGRARKPQHGQCRRPKLGHCDLLCPTVMGFPKLGAHRCCVRRPLVTRNW